MATTFEGKIAEALMVHVATIPGATSISYPNRPFEPTQAASGVVDDYLDVNHLPNGYALETTAYSDVPEGLLQISFMTTDGSGSVKPQDGAGVIISHFPKGLRLYGDGVIITITGRPSVAQTFNDGAYARTPVSISYQAKEVSP